MNIADLILDETERPDSLLTVDPRTLVNWIRGFDYRNCRQVQGLQDLKSGIVLGELIHEILLGGQKPDFLKRLASCGADNRSVSLSNISLCLKEIKQYLDYDLPRRLLTTSPQEIYEVSSSPVR